MEVKNTVEIILIKTLLVKNNIFSLVIFQLMMKNSLLEGEVDDVEPFKIGSKFIFKGTVNLTASNRLLTFDGFFKMKSNCNLIKEEWVGFSSEINPEFNLS